MKTNKKAILGFAVAMVFSLAFMQGISTQNYKQDVSLHQISWAAGYASGATEGGWSGFWSATSDMATGYAVAVGGALSYTWIVSGTNPAGWAAWSSVGAAAL